MNINKTIIKLQSDTITEEEFNTLSADIRDAIPNNEDYDIITYILDKDINTEEDIVKLIPNYNMTN